ncbi:MAG: beta strand repeat-containing protein, partial [Thermoleophilia bacterium]
MTAAGRSLRQLTACSAGALLLLLCSAGQAQAAAAGVCTSNAPDPGSTMTITIDSGVAPAATTIAVAGDVVTINMAPQAACAGLDAIVVNGDGAINAVTFTGSEAFTVTGDLGAGDDEFTTIGSQPVDIDGGADADTLRGGDGSDTLSGGDGADLLQGGPGTDTLNGDGGADTASYAERVTDVAVSVTGGGEDALASVENLTGGGGDDTLTGDAGMNVLDGGAGDDLLVPGLGGGANTGGTDGTAGGAHGAAGDTVSYADLAADLVVDLAGAPGSATATGLSQTLTTIENATGGDGDDTLAGDAGANILDGGGGDDLLVPGLGGGANAGGTHGTAGGAHGADGDTVSYAAVTDDLVADVDGTATATGLAQTLASVENLVGGAGDDTLTGDAGANDLVGGAGDDLLVPGLGGGASTGGTHGTAGGAHGASGDTVSYAGVAADVTADVAATATGSGLSQTLATVENLTGGSGDDTLAGDAGANILDGGGGDDLLVPGPGGGSNTGGAHGTAGGAHGDDGDTVSYAGVTADLVADVDGTATATGVAQTLATVENLVGGAGDDMLTGDAGDNDLDGGAGDDVLRPGLGGGANTGGAHGIGGDSVSYAGVSADVVADVAGAATATGLSQTLATVENLTGGSGDDTLTGDANDNDLDGGAGDDLLRPGLGGGASTGGTHGTAGGAHGDVGDTVSYAGVTAAVAADVAGTATGTGLSQTLATVENLTGGDGDDTLTGDAADNDLAGGGGDDLLVPGLGGGTNTGGAHGTAGDTVSYAGVTAGLALDVAGTATGTGVAQTLATVENLTGADGDDTLTGDDGANALDGGAGDDLLVPGRGGGSNTGGAHGAGGDTISYADLPAPVGVEASLAGGTATVDGATQTLVTAENLTGGAGDDTLTANGDPNVLRGGAGADILSGLGGDDLLMPGAGGGAADGGDDTDTVSFADVTPFAAPAVTVQASIAGGTGTVAGAAQTLAGTEHLTGSAGDDVLAGDDGDNILTGGGGEDTVSYADRTTGEDVVASLATQSGGQAGTAESDTLAGIENLTGGAGDDTLTGDPSANELRGLAGDDVLSGAAGDDVLLPGLGGGSSTGGAHGAAGDTVSFADLTSVPVAASLATGTATLLDPGADPDPVHALAEVENLTGGGGDDLLAGDHADNVLAGGAGGDTVSYADRTAAEPVTASLATGSGGQGGTLEDDDLDSIENLTGGAGDDTLTGDAGANVLRGGGGADTLSGGGDDDLLAPGGGGGSANGNGGSDTISYADAAPLAAPAVTVQASLAAGTATVAGVAQTLAGAEHLTGSAGDDVLAGDDGDNTLTGGDGEDTVSYADRTAGEDVVASLATLAGGEAGEDDSFASIENLTGGAGDDTLVGDAGANELDGGAGDDLLRPGGGNGASTGGTHGTAGGAHGDDGDTVSYEDVTGDVAADLLAGTATGTGLAQTLATVENLTGGGGDDTLAGDAGDNDLDGGAGDDVLAPGAGGGTSTGGPHGTAGGAHGADGDTVSFAGVAAALLVDLGGGSATGSGVAQTLATLENATGGAGDDTLLGDAGANRLDGGAGDALLRPGTGGGANTGGAHGAAGDTVSYVDVGAAPVHAQLSGIAT